MAKNKVIMLAPARYEAALDFLKQPLSAASDAAHELDLDPDGFVEEEEHIAALERHAVAASGLCPAKLHLLTSIARILWSDDEHDGSE
jgi:hypothetical protein